MIKRFNPDFSLSISHELAYMRETPEGGYVAHGDYATLFSELELVKADRDAQQKRADALAVESAEMREALDSIRIFSSDTLSGPADSVPDMAAWLCEGVEYLYHISNVETPATDAALAAIEARVWAEAKDLAKSMLATDSADHIDFLFDGKIQQLREAK